jgi:transcriptional regulator with XRE-family HTH domain
VLSATLSDGLKEYRIGEKLRALRLRKKMGLVELGAHTQLSPALLSKIERGRLFPTLPTLLRIALVFSVGLDHFFTDASSRPRAAVVRKKDRLRFPDRPDQPSPACYFESLDYTAVERRSNAYLADFTGAETAPHDHAGSEFLYVLRGRLQVAVGGDPHDLSAGDSMYFDSALTHTYRRVGSAACSALVVTVPA